MAALGTLRSVDWNSRKGWGWLLIIFGIALLGGCKGDEIASLPEAAACTGSSTTVVADPGFESADLNISWNPQQFSGGFMTFFAWFPPTEGASALSWDLLSDGPGTSRISQDITVAQCGTEIVFDYQAQVDNSLNLGQVFSVIIEPAGGGTPLQSTPVLTMADLSYTDTGGVAVGGVPVDSFRGQAVRIVFEMEMFGNKTTGDPSFLTLDNIRSF